MTHLLKLLDKMCKYEMDPMRLLKIQSGHDSVHRRTDGQTDKVIPVYPPINFVEAGGIINWGLAWSLNYEYLVCMIAIYFITVVRARQSLNSTHWGRDKMVTNFQTTFSNAFSWMKMFKFRLRFHWSLFPRVQLAIFQHWFRYWLGAEQATSHYLNQWW